MSLGEDDRNGVGGWGCYLHYTTCVGGNMSALVQLVWVLVEQQWVATSMAAIKGINK